MLSEIEKIKHLEYCLTTSNNSYADSFKNDILIFIGEFNLENRLLIFIKKLNSKEDIVKWIDKLTSRIVLKYDEETEQLSDFIYDYITLG
jgi:hypothetical protein